MSSALVGLWQGPSRVESTSGVLPECIAPFWRTGFTDVVSAEIQPREILRDTKLDLDFRQQAAQECHLQVGGSENVVTARVWPFDEFDCALVPALCNRGCHFRLKSSGWGCSGTPPEVWIGGLNLTGTFADAARTHIQGTVEIDYGHRPGNRHGGYCSMTIVERFEIRKTSP